MARRRQAQTSMSKAFDQDGLVDSEEDEWAAERFENARRTIDDEEEEDEEAEDDDGPVYEDEDDEEEEERGVGMYEQDEGEVIESEDEREMLNKQISAIPFGSLLKAKKQLNGGSGTSSAIRKGKQAQTYDEHSQDDGQRRETRRPGKQSGQRKRTDSDRHRSSKHAPMEMSSKKPVSRHRQIVETKTIRARDPRFDSLSGGFKSDLFKSSYGFLADRQSQELDELRKTANAARKNRLLPQEEKDKIEAALVRVQSREATRKSKERDEEALKAWKKEEQQKRKEGKKEFYLKNADKKKLQLKAKYDDLSQDKKQLRKAIEKKRRKISQKDKKMMPNRRP
ncbi:rRNA biogenesis protein rrp36 [Microbotryomycetes sp. JL201]|nr:rRNA biogenesis protein rrp36 [Microbotryomycetes sp. JL201]